MSTKTSERRAIGDALNSIAADLQKYAPFTIGRVTIHLDAGQFVIEIVDQFGFALNEAFATEEPLPEVSDFTYSAHGATFDDASVALARKLAGTEEAPF